MRDTLVIDIETQYAFAEVGGEAHIADLKVAVIGVYSYRNDEFCAFGEHELPSFMRMLEGTEHLIGFNIIHFDIPVLQPYLPYDVSSRMMITDLFRDAVAFLGHRVGLDALARATLHTKKSGHGLEALQWFREGRIDDVKRYCLDDVRITRDLYEYGKAHGHVLFESIRDRKIHSIPAAWAKQSARPVPDVLKEAYEGRKQVRIEYISSQDDEKLGHRKTRLIDIYRIKNNQEIEAYCHLRHAVRVFRLNRIHRAEILETVYAVPADIQPALF